MATHTLTSDRTTGWKVTGSNGTWTVKAGVKVKTIDQPGISEGASSHDNTIVINGAISSYGALFPSSAAPVRTIGTNTHIVLGETAILTGSAGILGIDFALGKLSEGLSVVNHGDINAGYFGIVSGKNTHVDNDGRIVGFYGMQLNKGNATVINRADGIIDSVGVGIAGMQTATLKVTNHGLINAGVAVGIQGTGKLVLVSDGKIVGDVNGDEGNDSMDMRGGVILGLLKGGKGNDTYIVDTSTPAIVENVGEGVDTLKSTVSIQLVDNVDKLVLIGSANIDGRGTNDGNGITGNTGNNKLLGLAGADRIAGGKGNDILTGGADADHFIFHKGDQVDTIADFVNGADKIDILGFGTAIDSFADLSGKITQVGSDVHINLGAGDKLQIKGALVADLDPTDFLFT